MPPGNGGEPAGARCPPGTSIGSGPLASTSPACPTRPPGAPDEAHPVPSGGASGSLPSWRCPLRSPPPTRARPRPSEPSSPPSTGPRWWCGAPRRPGAMRPSSESSPGCRRRRARGWWSCWRPSPGRQPGGPPAGSVDAHSSTSACRRCRWWRCWPRSPQRSTGSTPPGWSMGASRPATCCSVLLADRCCAASALASTGPVGQPLLPTTSPPSARCSATSPRTSLPSPSRSIESAGGAEMRATPRRSCERRWPSPTRPATTTPCGGPRWLRWRPRCAPWWPAWRAIDHGGPAGRARWWLRRCRSAAPRWWPMPGGGGG